MMDKIVGITGGIGSGKSTVSKIFNVLGIPVFVADQVAKEIVETNDDVIKKIKNNFGENIYDGALLNRKKLGEIVFSNPKKLEVLNEIIHPAVALNFENWLMDKKHFPYILRESAIMFEMEIGKLNRFNILVTASHQIKMQRIKLRDHLKEDQVQQRMDQQWTDEKKIKLADEVIINDNKTALIPQVLEVHKKLLSYFK